ncbi:ArnT family glycosyltransferase [Fredinandcohnia humi]
MRQPILYSFCVKFFLILLIVAFTSISIVGIPTLYEIVDTTSSIVFSIIAVIFISLILFLLTKSLPKKMYIFILIMIAFGYRLAWIVHIDSEIASDFEVMYMSAVRAAHGDFGFTSEGIYYIRWAYQLGFTMYQAMILNLFGEGTFYIRLFNVIYSVGTVILVYLIGRKLFNEETGRIAGLIYALNIPNIALSSVLTNQYLATFLFYLAFYLLISYFHTNKYIWAIVGLCLGLGDLIRPLGSLVLLAVGFYLFVANILKKDQIIPTIVKFAGIIVVYFLVHMGTNYLLIKTDVTDYSIKNREPLWKFVTGLNHDTTGIFSDEDAAYLAQFELGEERDEASKELIKERIDDKEELLELFKDKFIYMWTAEDGSLIWGFRSDEIDYTESKDILNMYERFMYFSMGIFVVIATITLLLSNNVAPASSLFFLLIIGYMCIHLLIELQTRYRFFIIPSFVLLQGYGVYILHTLLTKPFQLIRRKGQLLDTK